MTQLLLTATSTSTNANLHEALLRLEDRLATWSSNQDAFNSLLLKVFGVPPGTNRDALLANISGPGLGISVQILDATTMDGLIAAYTSAAPEGGERIYLNAAWLELATAEQIEAVLLEELGHAIDRRLNDSTDTAGDEGAIFSSLLRGETPDPSADRENDQRILILDGIAVAVEASLDTTRPTGSLLRATAPDFAPAEIDPFGIERGVELARPEFADIDGDGDLDLFIGTVGGSGDTVFFLNTAATPVAPVESATADGSYGIGSVINLTVAFSEAVVVDTTVGTPTLQLETGSIDRKAIFVSGSGTNTLTFQYTVQEGDTSADLDQLSSTALELNGGSIADAAGNNAILTLAAPGDTGSLGTNAALVIDTTRPTGSQGSFATAPAFAAAATNPFGITGVGSFASPAFADADNDGDLDLFIGNEGGDTVFFRNTAAPGSTSPAYAAAVTNPFGITGVGSFASPAFADADNDGDLDLFIGNVFGDTIFFRNTAAPGSTEPEFAAAEPNPFGITVVDPAASPALADADGDGDLDLFIGSIDGDTIFFRNTAAPGSTEPEFAAAAFNPFGITRVDDFSTPAIADADGDGDLDLFIGNRPANTLFFRNTAAPGSTEPEFAAAEPNPFGITELDSNASPALADADNDGDLDLVIGNVSGNTLFFRNTAPTPVAPVDSTTQDGSYGIGDVITLTVSFSEPVVVDTSGGTPTLQLETGTIDRKATFTSGSGSTTLTFRYIVQEGDTSADLDQLSSTALELNGGTIADAAGNNAILTLAEPGEAGSLGYNAALVIDTTRPTGSQGSFATAPAFAAAEINPFGIRDIGLVASPAFADADNDGDLDLFIGNLDGDTVFFRNTAAPDSTTPAYATAVTNPFGITDVDEASPAFADADNDGDLDLFIGSGNGDTVFFRNTAALGATSPAYAASENNPFGITNVGGLTGLGGRANPAFTDADNDGDLDLFIGSGKGDTVFFRNTAALGATSPAYAASENNPFGITGVGSSASPAFADVDGDGDLDLFISNFDGNTLFFRNTAAPGATSPVYAAVVTNPFGIASVVSSANPAFADIDGDGDLDLFIGSGSGDTVFFLNTAATPVAPVESATADGSYGIGDVINLTVSFSEAVVVNTSGGTPTLQLETGTIDRKAIFESGSGTNTLTFQYTVQEGDTSADLDQLSSTALELNGGSIADAAGNNAILTLAAPGDTGSLGDNAALVIDTTRPTGSQGSFATAPAYAAAVTNPFGIMDVGQSSSPEFADIDGDGDLDLFIGNEDGDTNFFRNTAAPSATTPAFAPAEIIPFGITNVGSSASPEFADIDGDGDLDLFISNRTANTLFFLNTAAASATAPAFAGAATNPFGITNVGSSASPAFADIDNDGDFDLFIGNRPANTLFFRNTGSASAPAYTQQEGTTPFDIPDVGSYAKPAFADIDNDGDFDLFIGIEDGDTLFFRNTGSANAPAFTQQEGTTPFGITDVGFISRPAFADIDDDGDLDLFIGNSGGLTNFFRNTAATPVAPVTSETASGTYGIGDVITLTVSFSEPVVVDTSGGTPTLQLETGTIDRKAIFTSGSGTNTLTFQYTVQEGDTSADLDQLSSTALELNGGSIADAAGNNAILTLAAPGDTGSLGDNAALVIDTTRPTGSQGSFATAPAFAAAATNPFGITDVRLQASPTLTDIDGDGDFDLFIGGADGEILFFSNTAVLGATSPAFAAAETNPFGITEVADRSIAKPEFADIDRDGDLDLFIGDTFGSTFFFRNTGSADTPAFIQEGGDTPFGIPIVINASPAFADADGDGDLDLFIGNSVANRGDTFFFRNIAAPGSTEPEFASAVTNPFGITDVGFSATPAFADADGDGDLDLFIGNSAGNTLFFRNTAALGATSPAYAASENNPFGISKEGFAAKPAFADADNDGDLDLFIGNFNGDTAFFLNTAATPVAPVASTTPDGTYGIGDVINLTVSFSEPVVVDTSGGTPTLQLETGTIDRKATFTSGSGTNTLTFQYTVQEGDTSSDLDQLSSTALELNGGSIADAAGNNAILTLADPGEQGSLGDNAALVIDGNQPTVTGVDSTNADVSYGIGDFINLTVSFSEAVVVDTTVGIPTLQLETGTIDRKAIFVSGSGTNTLTFQYTVQEGDTSADLDQLSSTALELNGGSIADAAGNNAILTLAAPGDTGSLGDNAALVIDTTRPTVTGVSSTNADVSYGIGDFINLTVSFSEAVVVDTTVGIPTLQLETGTIDRKAIFVSGSGTNTLTFQYTVQEGDTSADLDQLSSTALELNGGSIADAAGNNAILTLAAPGDTGSLGDNAALVIDTTRPTVTGVSSTNADVSYGIGDFINLTVSFSEAVVVDTTVGIPTLQLETGTIDRKAIFVSGSGTNTLTFQYTVQEGDTSADLDQLSSTALELNGGSIADAAGNNAILTLAAPGDTGSLGTNAALVIDGVAPTISVAINNGGDGFLNATEDSSVTISGSTTGAENGQTVSINITSSGGGTPINTTATVNSNSYSVSGLDLSSLNDGTLNITADVSDLAGNSATQATDSTTKDTTAPQTSPSFAAAVTNPFGITGVGSFAGPTFADVDKDGDLDLFIGEGDGNTLFFRNTSPSGATTPAFAAAEINPFGITNVDATASPAFADADNDGDLDLFIGNEDGDTFSFLNTAAASATAPAFAGAATNLFGITEVGLFVSPAFADADGDGDLDLFIGNEDGDNLFFRNTAAPGAPTPAFAAAETNPFGITDVGSLASPAFADADNDGDLDLFIGNRDGNTLFFRNTATPGATTPAFAAAETNPFGITQVASTASPVFADADNDGDLDLFIGDEDGNTLFFRNTAAIAPVNSATADGTYGIGSVINLTVTFDEDVVVTGTPALQLETGTIDRKAIFISGSGSTTLTFQYTVQDGDTSADLDQLSSTALELNGGSIADAAGNNAILTLAEPGDTGSLGTNADLVIDGNQPTVTGVSSTTADGSYGIGSVINLTVTFDEDVVVTGTPTLQLETGTIDRKAIFISGSGSTTLTFQYTVQDGDTSADLDQLSSTALELNGGSIADAAGNNAILTLAEPGDTGSLGTNADLVIDGNQPTVTGVDSTTADGSYGIGSVINLTVTFDEDVVVTGTPALQLETGTIDRKAIFTSGSGTNTLTFQYIVQDGDSSADLDQLSSSALALNGGTIQDAAGNNAILNLPNPGAAGSLSSNADLVIDGIAPFVSTDTRTYVLEASNPFGISDVGLSAKPTFADIDGDDDLDLFIGNRAGNTLFFRNTAASGSTAPAYAPAVTNPFGITDVGRAASPTLTDIDDDGDLDLFIGNRAGNTLFFRNNAPPGSTAPAYSQERGANGEPNPFGITDVGRFAKPAFTDTDNDGDLDLFIGNLRGKTLVFRNNATPGATTPAYAPAATNPFGINDVGLSAAPAFTDADGDGDLDLFIGNRDGNTLVFRNNAPPGSTAPAYSQERGANGEPNPFGITDVGFNASPAFADPDNDSDPDLFIGNAAGDTLFFRNTGAAPGVNSSTVNGVYTIGAVINLTIGFSKPVVVDTTGGTPTLQLETGTTDRKAIFTSGSGTNTLTFQYTVQDGDTSADLDQLSSTALALNGGSITDANGNPAILSLPQPGTQGSLSDNADLIIDTNDLITSTIRSSESLTLPDGLANLILTGTDNLNGTGNDLDNRIEGNSGKNRLNGKGGNDTLIGKEDKDKLTGGSNADTFLFQSINDSGITNATRDQITDFTADDTIDLSRIDADPNTNGDQAFVFIGSDRFSDIGQARFNNAVLRLNIDDDLFADFQINLKGVNELSADSLIL
ncbi:FG-GAP-like repeat-containing protein [Synechococcus sp. W2B2]|uniref:FG-GAP-like repeat-containing protein n=1 Tax=Synechococcus sp. W2B2 TaxID=3392296 RepID=UPI0039E7E07E